MLYKVNRLFAVKLMLSSRLFIYQTINTHTTGSQTKHCRIFMSFQASQAIIIFIPNGFKEGFLRAFTEIQLKQDVFVKNYASSTANFFFKPDVDILTLTLMFDLDLGTTRCVSMRCAFIPNMNLVSNLV